MAYYLKYFEEHSDYESFMAEDESLTANVCYCEDEDDIHYNYKGQYFTTEAIQSGKIGFIIDAGINKDMIESISYSVDNGQTWTKVENQNDKSENLAIIVQANAGDKILWKGNAVTLSDSGADYVSGFISNINVNIFGNIMSLLYDDTFRYMTEFPDEITGFYYLFGYDFKYSDDVQANGCDVVDASNLILPATTLTNYCYDQMFHGCTNLTTAPKLPATILANYCYAGMFEGCTSLINVPKLPATTLATGCYCGIFEDCTSLKNAPKLPATTLTNYCYQNMFSGCIGLTIAPKLPATTLTTDCYQSMFSGCTSLVNAPKLLATTLTTGCYQNMFSSCTSLVNTPELPATTLANYCYDHMFDDCTSLVNAPELPATTLANYCYQYMFDGCTGLTIAPNLPATTLASNCYYRMFRGCISLVNAPELPATTLASACYSNMFYGCISLTKAPKLPATTLVSACYYYMFNGCTSLVKAPELPATTLVSNCYSYMFKGCSRLNYIKAMFTTTPSTTYTSSWVSGVSATGIFIKSRNATWDVTGVHGVPSNWTISKGKIAIYIDDFPEKVIDPDGLDEFNNDMYEFKQYYVDNYDSSNTNKYIWYGETVEYNGQTLYLFEVDDFYDGMADVKYVLTTTADYNTLYNESLDNDLDNEFTSLVGRFNEDLEAYDDGHGGPGDQQYLVMVEEL